MKYESRLNANISTEPVTLEAILITALRRNESTYGTSLIRHLNNPLSTRIMTSVTMDAGAKVSLWNRFSIGDTPSANAFIGNTQRARRTTQQKCKYLFIPFVRNNPSHSFASYPAL